MHTSQNNKNKTSKFDENIKSHTIAVIMRDDAFHQRSIGLYTNNRLCRHNNITGQKHKKSKKKDKFEVKQPLAIQTPLVMKIVVDQRMGDKCVSTMLYLKWDNIKNFQCGNIRFLIRRVTTKSMFHSLIGSVIGNNI